jgi:hypothetical protein
LLAGAGHQAAGGLQRQPVAAREHPSRGIGDQLTPSRGLIVGQVRRRIADAAVGFRRGLAPGGAVGAEL